MRVVFILAQISSPKGEARPEIPPVEGFQRRTHRATRGAGGDILTNVKATQAPLCRPAGWIALWRRIGNLSVLNRMARA